MNSIRIEKVLYFNEILFKRGDIVSVEYRVLNDKTNNIDKNSAEGKIVQVNDEFIKIDTSQKYESSIVFINFDDLESISQSEK